MRKTGTVIHVMQLRKGYSLRVEWNGICREPASFDELVEALREEFGLGKKNKGGKIG